MTRRLECLFLAAFLFGLTAVAYPADDDFMRLARLSYIEGHVSFQYASDVEWSAASINMPLEPGDRIYTGRDGRAEIQFDEGSVYRLAEDTDIEILALSEHLIQMRILVGLSSLTVSSGLNFEINTPAAAFIPIRQGVYRFEVGDHGQTSAIVRKGELEAANNEFVRRIHSGERLNLHLGGGTELVRYDGRDSWDEWNDRRSADRWAYTSREYLPESVYIGISDLDRHGRWVQVESYGRAWVPFSVGVSWSPYSVGRWCYRPYYGWTWVSHEPWGWLPYHYGRWYQSAGFGWCWLPGPSFSFNFWSPGLVAFYNGPGWVSWCPLGPGDYYNINHYYFNRNVYHYQLPRLRGLHTRAAGRPLYRNDRGAFRRVPLDDFRNGNLRGNGVATPRGYVNVASREGSYVKDRLGVKPSRRSYSGDPDRAASRPGRSSELPAVVRTDPGAKARNRGAYTRVTNPDVTPSPSRVARNRNEADTRGGGRGSDPAVRNVEFGPAEQTNRGVRSQSGSSTSTESGRRTAVSRTSRNSTGEAAASANRQSNARAARARVARARVEQQQQQTNSSTSSSSTSARRSGSSSTARTPSTAKAKTYSAPSQSSSSVQRNSTTRSSSQARPRVEQRQQANAPTPSSSSSVRRSSSSGTAKTPSTARTRTYSAPSQSSSSVQRNSTTRSSSQARPRVEQRRQITTPAPRPGTSASRSASSSSSVRAPSAARTGTYSAPRQSSSSAQKSSISRSSRAPASTRSAQPSVRSSGGSSSSRSSGQAQRRSSSGSSGNARRR